MKTNFLIILIAVILATGAGAVYLYYNKDHSSLPILPEPNTLLIRNATPTKQPTKQPQQTPQQTQDTQVDNLIQNFYDFYSSCLIGHYSTTPTQRQPSKSPQEDCPYNQTGALTDQLALKLKPLVGYNPILCTPNQTIPDKITHSLAKIVGDKAVAVIHEILTTPTTAKKTKNASDSAQTPPQINIKVELEFQNAQWQITNITCLKNSA